MKVLVSSETISELVSQCSNEYVEAERSKHAPRHWSILAGELQASSIVVGSLYSPPENVRDQDPFLIAEYDGPKASKFGGVYKDLRRGYQTHAPDLLEIIRKASSVGQDILGSVHLHADLHNLDRPDESSPIVTEMATKIDQDLFRASGWPLNLIMYLERRDSGICWTMTAWVPGSEGSTSKMNYQQRQILVT